jgi:diaminohydroxyphosphoribosylaminopyrimidine deaminase/5-amino-6-(5-phosphoribosylamino)uracil reductase
LAFAKMTIGLDSISRFYRPQRIVSEEAKGPAMTKVSLEDAMNRALELALLGPAYGVNPQVGAVILNQDQEIVGEGFHAGAGTKHAEVVAIESGLKGQIRFPANYTAVVTLEPCNHTGKTGPCAKALIEAGISKVIFASSDPGDESAGGAETLREAGIEVVSGFLKDKADQQGKVWLLSKKYRRPYVTAKWASSLDGRIAAEDGTSKWITSSEARNHGHLQRSNVDAILVGTATAVADDPELTARKPDGSLYAHQPLRVIMGERELPPTLRLFNSDAETVHLKTQSIHGVLADLYERGVKHLLVEGGPTVESNFFRLDLVDDLLVYLAPQLLGGSKSAIGSIDVASIADSKKLFFDEVLPLGPDVLIRASVVRQEGL